MVNDQISNDLRIESFLSESKAPLSFQQIYKSLRKFKNNSNTNQCKEGLEELLNCEKVFRYPPLRKNGKERYWNIQPSQYVKNSIHKLLRKSQKRQTYKSVKTSLPKWEQEFFDEAIGYLITERNVFEVTFGRTKYLEGINTLLNKLLEWFNAFRNEKLTYEELENFLKGKCTEKTGE